MNLRDYLLQRLGFYGIPVGDVAAISFRYPNGVSIRVSAQDFGSLAGLVDVADVPQAVRESIVVEIHFGDGVRLYGWLGNDFVRMDTIQLNENDLRGLPH